MEINSWSWIGFIGFVIVMLVVDLGLFHRKSHEVKIKEALTWSAIWIMLALLFAGGIHWLMERKSPRIFGWLCY